MNVSESSSDQEDIVIVSENLSLFLQWFEALQAQVDSSSSFFLFGSVSVACLCFVFLDYGCLWL
jgi:hypothetical protein